MTPSSPAPPRLPGSGRARGVFRAVAACVVPDATRLDAAQWDEVEAIVARAIAARPRGVRRQVALFLELLEWLPLFRYGRRLSRLDPARRARFLALVQRAPLLLLRRGFWGVRTLILMGYYGRPAAAADIGYRADARGWEARRGASRRPSTSSASAPGPAAGPPPPRLPPVGVPGRPLPRAA